MLHANTKNKNVEMLSSKKILLISEIDLLISMVSTYLGEDHKELQILLMDICVLLLSGNNHISFDKSGSISKSIEDITNEIYLKEEKFQSFVLPSGKIYLLLRQSKKVSYLLTKSYPQSIRYFFSSLCSYFFVLAYSRNINRNKIYKTTFIGENAKNKLSLTQNENETYNENYKSLGGLTIIFILICFFVGVLKI